MKRSVILPILGYAGYPLAVVGATLVFASSSLLTLQMISAHVGAMTRPITSSPDFNLPPVEQIGSLETARSSEVPAPQVAAVEPESSIAAVAPPDHTVAVAVAAPEATPITAVEPPGLVTARIGPQAVNVRAAPSKTGAKIGVLDAGARVRIGQNEGGWIHVFFEGGDGWVYQSYLAGGDG